MRIPVFIRLPGEARPEFDPAERLLGLAGRALRALRRWWRVQRTLEDVAHLDDATLRDIGVQRGELRAHVQAAARAGETARRWRDRW